MSVSRRCDIYKATDGKVHLVLGNFEHAENDSDCTAYGPFNDQEAAEAELETHSNPGHQWTDMSGTKPPPGPEINKAPKRRTASFGWR